MKSDTGLVQDVADADQARTDLGRQTDPLRLAARERRRRARKGQIIQADVDQEADAGADLLEDLPSDLALGLCQFQLFQEILEGLDGKPGHFVYINAADRNSQRLLAQSLALADLAGLNAHKGLIFRLGGFRSGLAVAALSVADDALEGDRVHALAPLSLIIDVDALVRAVHEHIADVLRQILVGSVQAEAEFLRHGHQDRVGKAALVHAGLPSEDRDRTLIDGPCVIRDDQLRREFHAVAESRAVGACAERIVEGETPGLDLRHTDPAVRAGKTLRELHHLAVHHVDLQKSFRQLQRVLDGIRKSPLDPLLDDQSVDHDLDIVLDVLLQFDVLGHVVEIAVDAKAHIAGPSGPVDDLLVFALPPADDRSQDLDPGALRELHNAVHHLVYGLSCDLPAAVGAVGNADPRVEQPEIVVDLRHGSHRRPGVPVGGFLVDGDRGGESVDLLHVRLLHLAQELSRVGGQRLHVPPLPLRVDGVKSQRGLARSRQPCQHDQLVARNLQGEILEVVLIGAADPDAVVLVDDAPPSRVLLSLYAGQPLALFQGGPVIRFLHLNCHTCLSSIYEINRLSFTCRRSAPARAS